MASQKIITIAVQGKIERVWVRKPPAPRGRLKWISACDGKALAHKARRYAVRMGGTWEVYDVSYSRPVRTFATEAAAAMWLLHQGGRHRI